MAPTPATGAGRPLYLHLWYPTGAGGSGRVAYTWNNPVYNQNPSNSVYPGLPDLPALSFPGSPSLHPVAENAPLARGHFPLLVATHGNLVAAAKNMPDTLETLASHGYIVASVEHTGNNDASYQASFLEGFLHIPLGPNPSLSGANLILQRSKDVSFTIDQMLLGTVDQKAHIGFSRAMRPGEHRRTGLLTWRRDDAGDSYRYLGRKLSRRPPRQGGVHGCGYQLRTVAQRG